MTGPDHPGSFMAEGEFELPGLVQQPNLAPSCPTTHFLSYIFLGVLLHSGRGALLSFVVMISGYDTLFVGRILDGSVNMSGWQ